MERVRREIRLGATFDDAEFAAAFATFRAMYHVAPERAFCAPDVFARACELFDRAQSVHHYSTRLHVDGVPLLVAILAPGTLAMEGEVDEERMGDW